MPATDALALDSLLPELRGAEALRVTGIESDSRRVRTGQLFVGLESRHGEGRRFLAEAFAAGAAAALVQGPQGSFETVAGRPCWTHPEAPRLLGEALCRWHRWDADTPPRLVGVTGTNGKSSVTWLIAQLAGAHSEVLGTLGAGPLGALRPLANTTPAAVELWTLLAAARDRGARSLAMEVSSHALALQRVAGVPFTAAVFTNLSRDHLDFHGSMAAYGAAKAKLFESDTLHLAVLNADDPFSATLRARLRPDVRILGYGFEAGDYRVREYHPGASATLLVLDTPSGTRRLRLPLIGRANVRNFLAALASVEGLGFETDTQALADLHLPPGRYQRLLAQTPEQPDVLIDYAHTPDALRQVLEDLRAVAKGRITVVFGCGGDRDRGKRPEMGAVAAALADRVVLTDDNPRSETPAAIVADILEGIPQGRAEVCHERAAAIAKAIGEAGHGDWVLIAGKGHEQTQEIAGEKRPCNDLELAREALHS
ncbi:UDP-N-acetylmuramoyl-L-alanyl-D-glutamate--2,6-diaminopimelate ligase [Acidithiobacillus sp.]|uniref:UDP-N-acetylmuramoyl-L-alanyl-D-glutamate--2, 6-diaminopimelate ligase n=1 Tax=Acidithiobacillus sp. TaxID=1872118 RepID=UPI0025BE3A47|nr:UDP-N-acetylmuramoyl-L-alanyl-D-glutamate--2,6-diaminopimelate ligase [Acidithiobacillus sp.]